MSAYEYLLKEPGLAALKQIFLESDDKAAQVHDSMRMIKNKNPELYRKFKAAIIEADPSVEELYHRIEQARERSAQRQ